MAEKVELTINLSRATKILHQIPDIVKGVNNWIKISQAKINGWVENKIMNEVEKQWFTNYLLPFLYWQFQLKRTKNGRSNPHLMNYYENRLEQTKEETLLQIELLNILPERQHILSEMACCEVEFYYSKDHLMSYCKISSSSLFSFYNAR